jgi:ABC-type nickel/cobalt efflux system permease component RcnA
MVDAHLELLNELSIYIHSVQLVMQVSGGSILVGNVAMWAVSDKGSALFAWLISHQPAVLFSHNKPATSNQPTVLFCQNRPATSQPNRL